MKWMVLFCLLLSILMPQSKLAAQEQEVQQLLLNVEKLAQMKEILEQLKSGYAVVAKGYLTVKNISEGNFSLHKVFLDGLVEVSPAVRNYHKVTEIVKGQVRLIKTCKATLKGARSADLLKDEELDYLSGVVDNLMRGSLRQIEALATVLSSGTLRMSDEERLDAIDRLWAETKEQQTFLASFSSEAKVLLLQRFKGLHDNAATRRLYSR